MKAHRFRFIALAAFFAAQPLTVTQACGLSWAWSVEDALEEGQRDGKLVLLFFTGSDWSPRSIALDKQALEKPEFSNLAAAKFALYLADFPQRSLLSVEFQKANDALAERLGIRHFPTIVALLPNGKEFARLTYTDESSTDMAGWLTWCEDSYRKELAASAAARKQARR
jgi:thiol-disulfide isomerase/thioredoxin